MCCRWTCSGCDGHHQHFIGAPTATECVRRLDILSMMHHIGVDVCAFELIQQSVWVYKATNLCGLGGHAVVMMDFNSILWCAHRHALAHAASPEAQNHDQYEVCGAHIRPILTVFLDNLRQQGLILHHFPPSICTITPCFCVLKSTESRVSLHNSMPRSSLGKP